MRRSQSPDRRAGGGGGPGPGGPGGGGSRRNIVPHPSEKIPPMGSKLIIVPNNIPRDVRDLVDHVAELVKQGGTVLEQNIYRIAGGDSNPNFAFMKESYRHQVACYYRWRLYSLLQGDSLKRWRTDPYVITHPAIEWWVPPPLPGTRRQLPGVPRSLINDDDSDVDSDDGAGTGAASRNMALYADLLDRNINPDRVPRRRRWFELLRAVDGPKRDAIGDAMVFAVENSAFAFDMLDTILVSLDLVGLGDLVCERIARKAKLGDTAATATDNGGDKTLKALDGKITAAMQRTIGRLFLLSDIYANRFDQPRSSEGKENYAAQGFVKANTFVLPRLFNQVAVLIARVSIAEAQAAGQPTAQAGTHWRTEHAPDSPVWHLVGWLRELWAIWTATGSVDGDLQQEIDRGFGFILSAPDGDAADA